MREFGYEHSIDMFSPEEMKEVLRNPGYLPTREEIFYAFTGEKHKLEQAKNNNADEQGEAHFDEEAWKKAFNQGVEFFKFYDSEEEPTFEFFNEEYLNDLSDYLSQRVLVLKKTDEPITILEVGSGNGRLTHFLEQKLNQKIPGKFRIIATDSGSLSLKTAFPVDRIDQKKALQKYQPQMVICSWMPYRKDFSADFRATENVEEYILIGDIDCCGNDDSTYEDHYEVAAEKQSSEKEIFNKHILEDVSRNQFCRTDRFDGRRQHSLTISYHREKQPQITASMRRAVRYKQPVADRMTI